MRIKSIKPTEKFQHIEFREIFNNWQDKKVYTPNGFQPVLAFDHIKTGPTKVIQTSNGFTLECDPRHRVLARNIQTDHLPTEYFANELDSTKHELLSFNNQFVSFTIEDGKEDAKLYDIRLPPPHFWYTSGVASHNSIQLVNNAITSVKGIHPDSGVAGQDVLLVTFELDTIKTALRCLGVATGYPLNDMKNHKQFVIDTVQKIQNSYNKKLYIYELPPDECSVDHIYALIDNLKRTKGWKPDVVIIDYLELMTSRHAHYNKDEYMRQKHVATEVRGLAKNEHVLIFTATQTNRGGADAEGMIELDKMAESYGKAMPLDYVISLNQSDSDRAETPARIRYFVAKNRNGPKFVTIDCTINYNTMQVKEVL